MVTENYSENPEEEGLLISHLEKVKEDLKKENIFKKSIPKKIQKIKKKKGK